MKMIIVVMMLYNGKDGGHGDNREHMSVSIKMIIVMMIFHESDQ